MRSNELKFSNDELKIKCQYLIENHYKAALRDAAEKNNINTYAQLVAAIQTNPTLNNGWRERSACDAINTLAYNYPLDDNGNTALHLAAIEGHVGFVQYLCLLELVDVNCQNKFNYSALHLAAAKNQDLVVVMLLKDFKANPNLQSVIDSTPLHIACRNWQGPDDKKRKAIIELLFQHGADDELTDNEGKRPDQESSYYNQDNPLATGVIDSPSNLKRLIDRGSDFAFQKHTQTFKEWYKRKIDGLFIIHYAAKRSDHRDSVFFKSIVKAYASAAGCTVQETLSLPDQEKNQTLHFVAQTDNKLIVQWILEQGINPNILNSLGQTPFHLAVSSGDMGVLKLLFPTNKEPFSTEQLSQLLQIAMERPNSQKIFTLLLDLSQTNIDWQDGAGNTLLHLAATRSLQIVHYLTEQGLSLTAVNKAGQTPEQMKRENKPNVIAENKKVILNYMKGESQSKPTYFNKAWLALDYDFDGFESTLLHDAAAHNNVVALKELQAMYEGDWTTVVNKQHNKTGGFRPPLGSAVKNQSTGAIEFLLQNGADPSIACIINEEISKSACTPFAYCVAMGWTKKAQLFLACEPRPDLNQTFEWLRPKDMSRFGSLTPLHAAIQGNHSNDLIFMLVKAGADVSIKCFNKPAVFRFTQDKSRYPLKATYDQFLKLISNGKAQEIFNFLKTWNPTWLKVVDKDTKLTPIHLLAQNGHVDTLNALLKNFPDTVNPLLNQADETKYQQTPLHHAVLWKKPEMVQCLLAANINKDAPDADGNTAYHLAIKSGNEEIILLLKNAGVNKTIKNNKGELAEEMGTGWFGTSKNIIQTQQEQFKEAILTKNVDEAKKLFEKNPSLLHDQPDVILNLVVETCSLYLFYYLGEIHIRKVGNDQLVKKYINQPTQYNTYNRCFTEIIASEKRWDLVDWYFQHDANFNADATNTGSFPIWMATSQEDIKGVQQLLRYTVEVNVGGGKNIKSHTPLMVSVKNKTDGITELLLCARADTAQIHYNKDANRHNYAHNYEDSKTGYLHQKAQLVLEILTIPATLLLDFKKLLKLNVDTNSLISFKKSAEKNILPEWIEKNYSIPESPTEIFTDKEFKLFLNKPFEQLQKELDDIKQTNFTYKKERAKLLKPLVDLLLDRFNVLVSGANRWKTVKEGVIALQKVDVKRGNTLWADYINKFIPFLDAIEKDEKKYPINKDTFDYTAISAEKYEAIVNAVPKLETNLAQLEAFFLQVKKEIYTEQKAEYALLEQSIEKLNTLKKQLLPDVLESSGLFSSNSTGHFCLVIMESLASLKNTNIVTPSVEHLSENQTHLKTLKDHLPKLLVDLSNAETNHQAQQQKEQQEAAEKQKQQAVAQIQSELKTVNKALKTLRLLWEHVPQNSPVRMYWISLSEDDLPKKDYYSGKLILAIKTIRNDYQTITVLLNKVDDFLMPPLLTDAQTAETIVSSKKIEEFKLAAQALKTSANQLFPLLKNAFAAEAEERAKLEHEAKLREDLQGTIKNINSACTKILLVLKGKPVDTDVLGTLNIFREAIGCSNKSLIAVDPNVKQLNTANEALLKQWVDLANAAQFAVDQYHQSLNKENAAKEQQRRLDEAQAKKENELRATVQKEVQTLNSCFLQIKLLLPNDALPNEIALKSITLWRNQLGYTTSGVEPIVIEKNILSGWKENELTICLDQAKKAQTAATQYLSTLQAAQKDAEAKAQREVQLRKELDPDVPKFEIKFRALDILQGKTTFKFTLAEPLAKFRLAVTCSGKDLEPIKINQNTLLNCDEMQLNALKQQLGDLNTFIDDDNKALRQRNRTQLLSTVNPSLQLFNTALQAFSGIIKDPLRFPKDLQSLIQAFLQQISNTPTWKPFTPLTIEDQKAGTIPPEQHQAIADELKNITTKINDAKKQLEEQQTEAQRQERKKQEALDTLQTAVTDKLNPLVETAKTILAKGGKLLPSVVSQLNTFSIQFEARQTGLISIFTSKPVSTETVLKKITFDQKHCTEQFSTTALKQLSETVCTYCTTLNTALGKITEAQQLQAQLKTVHEQLSVQIKLLPSEENISDLQSFITLSLIPDSQKLCTANDIDALKATLETAQKHLNTLKKPGQKSPSIDTTLPHPTLTSLVSTSPKIGRGESKQTPLSPHPTTPSLVSTSPKIGRGESKQTPLSPQPTLTSPVLTSPEIGRGESKQTPLSPHPTLTSPVSTSPKIGRGESKQTPLSPHPILTSPVLTSPEIGRGESTQSPLPTSPEIESVKSKQSSPPVKTPETPEELLSVCDNLADSLLEKLRENTEKNDPRRQQFQTQFKAVKANKQNPTVLKAALKEFRQIGGDFFSDTEIQDIESGASSEIIATTITTTPSTISPSSTSQTPIIQKSSTSDLPRLSRRHERQTRNPISPQTKVLQEDIISLNKQIGEIFRENSDIEQEFEERRQKLINSAKQSNTNSVSLERNKNDFELLLTQVKTASRNTPQTTSRAPLRILSTSSLPTTSTKSIQSTSSSGKRSDTISTHTNPATQSQSLFSLKPIETPISNSSSSTTNNQISKKLLATNKQERRNVIDLLKVFKQYTLDVPRYSLKYHCGLLNEKGNGLTPEERHHFTSMIQYLDLINEWVKKEMSDIEKDLSSERPIDYTRYTKKVKDMTTNIESLLQSLVNEGTASYESPLSDLEIKKLSNTLPSFYKNPFSNLESQTPPYNLKDINISMEGQVKRGLLSTQTEPHPQSPIGLYNNLPGLLAALSKAVTENNYKKVQLKIYAFTNVSSPSSTQTVSKNKSFSDHDSDSQSSSQQLK